MLRKTYILMGVPSCITEELPQQDDMVLEATRMTKWNNNITLANHTDIVKVVLKGKEHFARFTRGYGSFRIRPFVKGPQQCFNCQKFGHHARTCRLKIQTGRYCEGRHHSHQCKDNKQLTLKCANCGQEHATTSCLCPKRIESEKKAYCTSVTTNHITGQQETAPIPLDNA